MIPGAQNKGTNTAMASEATIKTPTMKAGSDSSGPSPRYMSCISLHDHSAVGKNLF